MVMATSGPLIHFLFGLRSDSLRPTRKRGNEGGERVERTALALMDEERRILLGGILRQHNDTVVRILNHPETIAAANCF
jgi:hypothetical protein